MLRRLTRRLRWLTQARQFAFETSTKCVEKLFWLKLLGSSLETKQEKLFVRFPTHFSLEFYRPSFTWISSSCCPQICNLALKFFLLVHPPLEFPTHFLLEFYRSSFTWISSSCYPQICKLALKWFFWLVYRSLEIPTHFLLEFHRSYFASLRSFILHLNIELKHCEDASIIDKK